MKLKMIDERKMNAKLESMKYSMRKQIKDEYGKNSRRSRNLVKNLRKEAGRSEMMAMRKNESKMKHLRKKYREGEEEKIDKIPESMKDLNLEKLSIFDKKKFEEKTAIEYEAEIIGNIELTNNERLILRLPPKFAIEENLPEEGMALDEELAYAKKRMTISMEEEEKIEEDEGIEVEEDEEKEEEMEKMDAMTRQIYDTKQ